ncbi:hypothetical protein A2165_00910 [Candidatus Curtissbacteria bacterium RBG_13_40_7]|uniref:Uncharacterized protein n=1 Tax=Candidatus Curtissbacteria bacterium RBG_13_40_7 TaxID=1797706 RepID=A0A1F5FWT2_9BACT|nr:MAG: hypothetical protein A2165_00910 [Candidatus Curtissbacteria bacterium RBG_13_40_7]
MKDKNWKGMHCGGPASAVYGLGLVGAVVYFIQHATTFGEGVWGVLKAIVWPAILAYKLLELLQL